MCSSDLPAYRERKSYLMVKRYIEIFRWCHNITDGVSLNSMPYSVASYVNPDYNGFNAKIYKIEPWPGTKELTITQPVYAFRTAYYPVQALMRIENRHILSGDSSDAPIKIVNDSQGDATVDLLVLMRDATGKTRDLFSKKSLVVKQGGESDIAFKLNIPSETASGKYTVEL